MKFVQRDDGCYLSIDPEDIDDLAWYADEKLRAEIAQLREAVTRCQAASTADVKRRRKAEWQVLKLRDELKKADGEKALLGNDLSQETANARSDLLNLADACIQRKVGRDWPAIDMLAKHYVEKYRGEENTGDFLDPAFDLGEPLRGANPMEVPRQVTDNAPRIDPKLLLALCSLRDDLDGIGAGGWRGRVVEIINLVTGKE